MDGETRGKFRQGVAGEIGLVFAGNSGGIRICREKNNVRMGWNIRSMESGIYSIWNMESRSSVQVEGKRGRGGGSRGGVCSMLGGKKTDGKWRRECVQ